MSFLDILSQLGWGVAYTILVTFACSVTGVVAGLVITGLRSLAVPGLAYALNAYTYIFRGVPVLVLLFLVYFGLPSIGIRISPLVAMMCSLGLIAGAYLSEVFRGALASVDPAEILAAEAMGMSLPGSAAPPAVDRRRDGISRHSGEAVVNLIKQHLKKFV